MIADDLEYVGFWPRVGAALIDSMLALIVTAPLIRWIYGPNNLPDVNALLAMDPEGQRALLSAMLSDLVAPRGTADVLINVVLPALAIIVFWLTREATPGKMVFDARVVDATTGKAISPGQAIARYLGYYLSIFPLFLGLLWVGIDPRKQGFHDKLAGTVVVREKTRRH